MNDEARAAPGPMTSLLLATEHTEQDAGAEALALASWRRRGASRWRRCCRCRATPNSR
ncbi:MAG: hypothetical protein U1F49_14360 [Rubrivivax sp.]